MSRAILRLAALAGLLAGGACRKDPAPVPAADPAARGHATAATATVSTATAAASSSAPPTAPAIGRSKVPAAAEWKAATKLALDGGDWTGCVAEGIREWVRVSCRGLGRAGTPVSILVTKGQGADVLPYMKDGVTSLLFRLVPGTEIEALYAWNEDGDSPILTLAVGWPQGAATAPSPIGAFKDIPPSLSSKRREAECACYWQMAAMSDRATPPSAAEPCRGVPPHTFRFACLRAEGGDDPSCAKLIGCSITPSPDVYVPCLPGEVYAYASPTAYCRRVCAPDKRCPPGFACEGAGHGGESVCTFDKAR